MSSTILAYAVVGHKVDKRDLYITIERELHINCDDKGTGKFCSACGKPTAATEKVRLPIACYDEEGGRDYEGAVGGLDLVHVSFGSRDVSFVAVHKFKVNAWSDSPKYLRLPDDLDMKAARQKCFAVLDPHGLFRPEAFGIWLCLYYS